MSNVYWPLYEVFVRSKQGLSHRHVGSLHAADDRMALENARDNPPAIYCGYRILPGYAFGVGLQMVVDADRLNRAVIETAIADFRARGEHNWMSDVPAHVCYSGHPVCTSLKMQE